MRIIYPLVMLEQSETHKAKPSVFWTVPKLRRVDKFTNARPSNEHY